MEILDKLLTTGQAAKQLHISPRTLNNARSTGTGIVIPYHKIGSRVFYKQSDIEAYIENNTLTHTGEASSCDGHRLHVQRLPPHGAGELTDGQGLLEVV